MTNFRGQALSRNFGFKPNLKPLQDAKTGLVARLQVAVSECIETANLRFVHVSNDDVMSLW